MYRNRFCLSAGVCAVLAMFNSGTVVAADGDAGRGLIEAGVILDTILGQEFRRITRVRAALHECELDDKAAAIAPTDGERSRGEFEFSKMIFSSESADIKAWLATMSGAATQRAAVAAAYSLALKAYFSGVRDGASGSLIWVDEDDKKKLCAWMVREAEDFLRLRAGD